jgi:hypothetical protein
MRLSGSSATPCTHWPGPQPGSALAGEGGGNGRLLLEYLFGVHVEEIAMTKKISELSDIEFEGSLGEAFKKYSQTAEKLAHAFSMELELAEAEARAAISELKGHPLLFGVDTRFRARQVTKRLARMRELVDGIGTEARKFERDYRRHFLDVVTRRASDYYDEEIIDWEIVDAEVVNDDLPPRYSGRKTIYRKELGA